jgi:hypothetical protein
MCPPANILDEPDQEAYDRVLTLFCEESYQECLIAACNLLARAKELEQPLLYQTLAGLIQESAASLAPKAARPATPACSFCGKSAPDVRLGAGPSAFICNECVATFAGILDAPQPA